MKKFSSGFSLPKQNINTNNGEVVLLAETLQLKGLKVGLAFKFFQQRHRFNLAVKKNRHIKAEEHSKH